MVLQSAQHSHVLFDPATMGSVAQVHACSMSLAIDVNDHHTFNLVKSLSHALSRQGLHCRLWLSQVFLYILEQHVVGCVVAETVTKAWRAVSTGWYFGGGNRLHGLRGM